MVRPCNFWKLTVVRSFDCSGRVYADPMPFSDLVGQCLGKQIVGRGSSCECKVNTLNPREPVLANQHKLGND